MVRFFGKTSHTEVPIAEPGTNPTEHGSTAGNGEKTASHADEKGAHGTAMPTDHDGSESESLSSNAQEGVKQVEAMATVWTTSSLILAHVLIWIIYFVNSMQEGTTILMGPYVTSDFSAAPLLPATQVMSGLIGGLFKLPLAKIIDLWGRPQGYALMVLFMTLGLVMMAACQNVETYAAAQVFYWVGYNGLLYIIGVFVADTTSLKNRGLLYAWISSPYIITVFTNGRIASAFLAGPGWRWSFGAFAIIMPFVTMSLWLLMVFNYRKAAKLGVMPARAVSGRTAWQSFVHYVQEFDIIGVLILVTGLALFLLAFNIYSFQTLRWRAPIIIAFLIIGGLLIIGFVVWEKFFARVNYIPLELLKDRTCMGAFIVAGTTFTVFYLWDSYFYSFILVVNNLDTVNANYVLNIYTIGACFWSFIIGALIRFTGHFKWLATYFAIPFTILGVGLMIAFREPGQDIGLIAMCQVFIAIAGGGVVITEQIAALAATSHQYIAVVLAIEGAFSSVGGAIGQTVATAIWTGVFPGKLAANLPEESKANASAIYLQVTTQLTYPPGDPTRLAIQQTYGETQKLMLIAACVLLIVPWIAAFCWRDINVKHFKQTKGNVL